jgi:hypothetical protein
MPEISDETEQMKTVVVRQRAYTVPADVATELARLQRQEKDNILQRDSLWAERKKYKEGLFKAEAELARLREENERLWESMQIIAYTERTRGDKKFSYATGETYCRFSQRLQQVAKEALAGGEEGK